MEQNIANAVSVIVSIIFAFFTNKVYVFKSKSFKRDIVYEEFVLFFTGRLFTMFLDMFLFFIFAGLMGFDGNLTKLFNSVFVIILNYIISKKTVFTKSEKGYLRKIKEWISKK